MLRYLVLLTAVLSPLTVLAGEDEAQAALERGRAFRSKGEIDNALREFTEAIRLNPRNTAVFVERGNMWRAKKQYGKAAEDYAEAIRLNPQNVMAYHNSASLRATCPDEQYRDGKKAVEESTKANEMLDWKEWWCVETLASAYAEAGDFPNAVKWQEKAVDLTSKESGKANLERTQKHLKLFRGGKPLREE